jgi:hypothetical protein
MLSQCYIQSKKLDELLEAKCLHGSSLPWKKMSNVSENINKW